MCNLLRAPVHNPCKRFPEPKAACARGYGGMLEVDLGDPVCPWPAQPAKPTAGARQERPGGRRLRWLCTTCVHLLKTGRQSQARGCGVAVAAGRAESRRKV